MLEEKDLPPQIEVTDEMRLEIQGALAEIDPEQMAIISKMTQLQRNALGLSLCESVMQIAIGIERKKFPDLSDGELRRRVLERHYASEPTTLVPQWK